MMNDLDTEDSRGSYYSDDSWRHDDNDESVPDHSISRERDKRFNRKGKQGQKEVDEHPKKAAAQNNKGGKALGAKLSCPIVVPKKLAKLTKKSGPCINACFRKG